MNALYFDCSMGAAGDMLAAALLDLLPDPVGFAAEFNALGIPGVTLTSEEGDSLGLRGCRVRILVNGAEEESCSGHRGEHYTPGTTDISALIDTLPLPQRVKNHVKEVYRLIAEAEAAVHGCPVDKVHFHEVGAMDAVADICAVCMLLDRLAPEKIFVSPIHVGSGTVRCAHGILPVPAPATAELLKGIPFYGSEIKGELCTPTGAALLKYFADSFGPQPLMTLRALGTGLGKKEFSAPNCLRVFSGDLDQSSCDTVSEICCNLDDMTGEAIGFAAEVLLEHGALDVYTVPIGMKKSRPGTMLCCLCRKEDEASLAELMLRHTTSLGVRISTHRRRILPREIRQAETPLGKAAVKLAPGRVKAEYEDTAQLARTHGISYMEAAKLAEASVSKDLWEGK